MAPASQHRLALGLAFPSPPGTSTGTTTPSPVSYNSRRMPLVIDAASTASERRDERVSPPSSNSPTCVETILTSTGTIAAYDDSTDESGSSSDSDDCDTSRSSLRHNISTAQQAFNQFNRNHSQDTLHVTAVSDSYSLYSARQDVLDGTAFEDAVEHQQDEYEASSLSRHKETRKVLESLDPNSSHQFEWSPKRLNMVSKSSHNLHTSESSATIRQPQERLPQPRMPHRSSFELTDLADLDLESILDAYADWDAAATESALLQASSARPPSFPAPSPPSSYFVKASAPPRPAKSGARSVNVGALSPLVYSDIFPSHRVAPFPTVPKRRKSSASLAPSDRSREDRDIVPPLPTMPTAFATSGTPCSSSTTLFPTVPPFVRRSSDAASFASSSSARSRAVNRVSVTSSIASSSADSASSNMSFRWSTYSGSTAPSTIAESDGEHGSSRVVEAEAAGSGYKAFTTPSTAGAAPRHIRTGARTPRHVKRQSEMMDWTTFAHELLAEEEREEEALVSKAPGGVRPRSANATQASSRPVFTSHSRPDTAVSDEALAQQQDGGYIHFDRELQRRKSAGGSIRSAKSARSARSSTSTANGSIRNSNTAVIGTTNVHMSQQQADAQAKSLARKGLPEFISPPPATVASSTGVRFEPNVALRAMRSSPNLKSGSAGARTSRNQAINRGLARVMLV